MIGGKTHAVHQKLPLVERAEIDGRWLAQPDQAQELVVGGIGDRHRVGKLFGGVDAISVSDRNVRIGGTAGRLASQGAWRAGKERDNRPGGECGNEFHLTLPS
jgi:hypothetical protein